MSGIGWQGSTEGIAERTDTPADATHQDQIAQDAEGKHLVLGVENFAAGRHAYLRLGAASPRAGAPTETMLGEDLATLVQGFTDDTRDRGNGGESPPAPAQSFDPASAALFAEVDAVRDAHGHVTHGARQGVDPRVMESAVLHKKGGWRDHSDGNRITTTRGDKVEVVQGNYKLVVLGRQSVDQVQSADPAQRATVRSQLLGGATGFDFSGGVNDEAGDPAFASDPDVQAPAGGYDATTPDPATSRVQQGLGVEYQWHVDSDGHWSWTITNNQGAPGASGNYRVINHTYVDHQEDNYGGGINDQRLEKMIARTWAKNVFNQVVASGVQTDTSGGTVENFALVGGIVTTNVGALKAEIDGAVAIGLAQVSFNTSLYLGGPILTAWVPFTTDWHVGPHVDTHAGVHTDCHVGMHQETRFGVHMEEHLGLHVDMHVGTHFDMDDNAVTFAAGDTFHVHASSGRVDWTTATGGDQAVSASAVQEITPAQSLRVATAHQML